MHCVLPVVGLNAEGEGSKRLNAVVAAAGAGPTAGGMLFPFHLCLLSSFLKLAASFEWSLCLALCQLMVCHFDLVPGKHPVSALMELCKKRHWSTPAFDQVAESGPAHRKKFLFKVRSYVKIHDDWSVIIDYFPIAGVLEMIKTPVSENSVFQVRVNNVDYQPNVASNNKKLAKMNAAIVCLQALGIPCQAI